MKGFRKLHKILLLYHWCTFDSCVDNNIQVKLKLMKRMSDPGKFGLSERWMSETQL